MEDYNKHCVFCCSCGINKEGQSSGDNPTTMCSTCVNEVANFCVKCGDDLYKTTVSLCALCRREVLHHF